MSELVGVNRLRSRRYERIDFDGRDESVEIMLRPTGIRALAEDAA